MAQHRIGDPVVRLVGDENVQFFRGQTRRVEGFACLARDEGGGPLEDLAALHVDERALPVGAFLAPVVDGDDLVLGGIRTPQRGSDRWDVATYGIPIPQVDQMPAGLIGVFMMSMGVLGSGRTTFTDDERASVEVSRYRCFLLGLPADLLGETPQEIVDLLTARHVSLREGYDDETCGTLVRGTMAVDLFDTSTIGG